MADINGNKEKQVPPKRRRLTDLFVTGRPAKIADPEGAVDIWIQKLNPLEQQNALRRAGAERARALAFVEKRDSDDWGAAYAEIVDFTDKDMLIDVAIRDEMVLARMRAEHEVAAEEKWSSDDYLTGLIDSWEQEMKERWENDPDDEFALAVKEKLEEFDSEVNVIVEAEREKLARDYENVPMSELRETATEKLLEQRATTAFVEEFEVQQILYAVREPDNHSEYYFKDRTEVLGLHNEVRRMLADQYRLVAVDPVEGKDSPGLPGSSTSSEPVDKDQTSGSSGREESTA